MAKTLGERVARLDVYYAEVNAHLRAIKEHLETLNGDVAENSKFRVQQKTLYGVIAFAWVSVLIPLTAIAIAVLA
jgi:hypothetical protein